MAVDVLFVTQSTDRKREISLQQYQISLRPISRKIIVQLNIDSFSLWSDHSCNFLLWQIVSTTRIATTTVHLGLSKPVLYDVTKTPLTPHQFYYRAALC